MLCRAFLKKIPHWQGQFLFGVGGSRLMPLINNWHYGSVKFLWGITVIFVCAAGESQRPNECDRFMRSLELSYYMILIEGMVVMQR
jgi:hypothetical protein